MLDPLYGISQRQTPQNLMAEQALLGALLANNEAYERVSEYLAPEHFSDPVNGRIYKAIARRIDAGQHVDSVTLKTEFENSGVLNEVGGTPYLARLNASMVGIINAAEYGRTIHDAWLRRKVIALGENAVNDAFAASEDAVDQIEKIENELFALSDVGGGSSEPVTVASAAQAALDEGRLAAEGKGDGSVSTGLPSLDKAILGFRPGHLVIGAGRPGVGKTILGRNLAINAALGRSVSDIGEVIYDPGRSVSVAYFALEETQIDFGAASISQLADVELGQVLSGQLDEREWERVVIAQQRMRDSPLYIFDQPRQSIRNITRSARRLKRKHGKLGLIVVDYLQLMPDHPGRDKRLSVGANAYGLKELAKELGTPVVLLSQLARRVEERPDKRPSMGDLRESGEIEDAADAIILLYRDEYYYRQTSYKTDGDAMPETRSVAQTQWEEGLARVAGKAEFIIPKVRRASPTVLHMHFNGAHLKFGEPRR